MTKPKNEWIKLFRKEADNKLDVALKQPDKKKKSDVINKDIKQRLSTLLVEIKNDAKKRKLDK